MGNFVYENRGKLTFLNVSGVFVTLAAMAGISEPRWSHNPSTDGLLLFGAVAAVLLTAAFSLAKGRDAEGNEVSTAEEMGRQMFDGTSGWLRAQMDVLSHRVKSVDHIQR